MDRLASEEAEDLRKEGADVVIALTHLGVNVESAEGKNRSLDLWKNSTGIDFLIDGHSHTVMTAGPAGEPIQSTGTKFQYIGVLVIGPDGKIEDHYLVETEPLPADESSPVFAAAQKIEDRVNAEYEVKIAESEVEFTGEKEANRKGETNNGECVLYGYDLSSGECKFKTEPDAEARFYVWMGDTLFQLNMTPKGGVYRAFEHTATGGVKDCGEYKMPDEYGMVHYYNGKQFYEGDKGIWYLNEETGMWESIIL